MSPYPTLTIGMDSAVNYAVRAIDDLRRTATALPGRGFLVETLGGDAGHLARAVVEAACCPIVPTPEEPWNIEEVARRMNDELAHGHSIGIAGESVGHTAEIARQLEHHLGDPIRPTTLGHSQRGTSPSALDRQLGLRAGREAVYHTEAGIPSSLLTISESDITPHAVEDMSPMFDSPREGAQ